MAKCDVTLPEEFLDKLSKLGSEFDKVADKVLIAGGEIMKQRVKNNLESVIGKDTKYKTRSTGKLVSSIGLSPVRVDREGNHNVKIGFAENRGDNISNAKLANIIENGKSGQTAKPFLKVAKKQCKDECIEKMKKVFDEEIGKI